MRGFIGTDSHLEPGTEIITGHNLELKMVVIREVTVEEAQESATSMGMGQLDVVPGETFYEVEVTPSPVGSNN